MALSFGSKAVQIVILKFESIARSVEMRYIASFDIMFLYNKCKCFIVNAKTEVSPPGNHISNSSETFLDANFSASITIFKVIEEEKTADKILEKNTLLF